MAKKGVVEERLLQVVLVSLIMSGSPRERGVGINKGPTAPDSQVRRQAAEEEETLRYSWQSHRQEAPRSRANSLPTWTPSETPSLPL